MSRPLRLQFVAEDDESEPLVCSQCEEEVPLLAKLPISGLNDKAKPWIGLCRACVERLSHGFGTTEAAGRLR